MMHAFFVLSWLICTNPVDGPATCQRQPPPDVYVFWSRSECEAAASNLLVSDGSLSTGIAGNGVHFSCGQSIRWIPPAKEALR